MRDISIVGWGGKPSCKCKAPLCSETSLVLSTYLLFSPNFWDDSPTWEVFKIPCWCIWHMAYGISEFSASIMEPLFFHQAVKRDHWVDLRDNLQENLQEVLVISLEAFLLDFLTISRLRQTVVKKSLLTTCHRWAIWQVSMEMSENPGEVDTEAGKLGIKALKVMISSNDGDFIHMT